ncbi:MAG: hypothetical protein IPL36_13375 [Nigerium sp.]|nr:hypothetical protein [Nigerium sp.]
MLKTAEQHILTQPANLCSWRMQISAGTAETPSATKLDLPASAAVASFLAARGNFFALVRRGAAELTVQAMSLRDHMDACAAYAQAYLDLLRGLLRQAETTSGEQRQQRLKELRGILAIDSVHVVVVDFRGRLREAVLVAPTHPLRVLWTSAWTAQGQHWIDGVHATDSASIRRRSFVGDRFRISMMGRSAIPRVGVG